MFHKFFDEKYQTARSVIDAPKEEIIAAIGIEPERLDEIISLLKKGLEEAEVEETDMESTVESESEADESEENVGSEKDSNQNEG